jgi:hypothetical protein
MAGDLVCQRSKPRERQGLIKVEHYLAARASINKTPSTASVITVNHFEGKIDCCDILNVASY